MLCTSCKALATSSLKHAYVGGSAILLFKKKKDFARDSAITIFSSCYIADKMFM